MSDSTQNITEAITGDRLFIVCLLWFIAGMAFETVIIAFILHSVGRF
jgi:hypothetical protein